MTDFQRAANTIVLSDIHLSDAEPYDPARPLWKAFKRREHFVDQSFKQFLNHLCQTIDGEIELVLNGDIFDFDSVMKLPTDGRFSVNWLERLRGLASEEAKSRFKMQVILEDHSVWVEALKEFIILGNRVIFVIGNHDIELHWPGVQKDLVARLDLSELQAARVRFCEWFYISNQDTLIEHGNQYDSYCMCLKPINPIIRKGQHYFVRLPFGNLAGKFMLNGMGLMNPHAESSFIKSSLKEYFVFYYQHVIKTQPLMMVTWFWGALVTLAYAIGEGVLPEMKDPLTLQDRTEAIAAKANAAPQMIWGLKELHSHPAVYNPIKILRELWLDRAILLSLIVFGSFQFFSFLNVFVSVSLLWLITPVLLLLPIFIFYARSIESQVAQLQREAFENAPIAAKIARVGRIVHGHTHIEQHTVLEGVEYLNTGTWSPAYYDVACTQRFGRKCFAWIRPDAKSKSANSDARIAELYEWLDHDKVLIPLATRE